MLRKGAFKCDLHPLKYVGWSLNSDAWYINVQFGSHKVELYREVVFVQFTIQHSITMYIVYTYIRLGWAKAWPEILPTGHGFWVSWPNPAQILGDQTRPILNPYMYISILLERRVGGIQNVFPKMWTAYYTLYFTIFYFMQPI